MSKPVERMGVRKLGMLAGYGVGDFGLNIYWNSLSIWLVFWYTDVVGIAPETAGLIFLIGTIWDAFSDPFVAGLAERVRTRHGTYRPFLLWGGPVLGGAAVLLFWAPPLTGPSLIAALIVATIVFRTAYTLVAIPYAALSSRLTYDSVERTELSGVRMFCAFGGLLVVSLLFPPLARWFSGGETYTASGFQSVIVVGSIVATGALVACFLATRERPLPSGGGAAGADPQSSLWRRLRDNKALLLLLAVIFLQTGANASLMISMVYFIEANKAVFVSKEIILTSFAVSIMVGVPAWTLFIRWAGKKRSWCLSSAAVGMIGLHMLVFGPVMISGVPLQIVCFGLCFGAFAVLLWSFIPDAVEYGQIKSGRRSEGLVFGSVLVAQKISGGVMGVLVTQVLSGVGYDADLAVQAEGVGQGLVVFLSVCPALLLALSTVPVCLLPLNRRIHSEIVDRLTRSAEADGQRGEQW